MNFHLGDYAHFSLINWQWIRFTVAAFFAGALNAVAGGGSFLSFPAMLSMNIVPVQANATNTVALWPGQLTSIAAYRDDIRKNLRFVWPMGLAGLLGGAAGGMVLLITPQTTFMHMVPWLLLLAATLFALSDPVSRWLSRPDLSRRKSVSANPTHLLHFVPLFASTTAICFYIGYFGAGAGFLLITMLTLFGFQDLNGINALKAVSTTCANGIAIVIFVLGHQVVWNYCLLAMGASAVGGYFTARFARRLPQPLLRGGIILIGFTMAAWFFWRNR